MIIQETSYFGNSHFFGIIHEFHTAYIPKADLSLASGVFGEELVNRTLIGWLAGAVVVIACNEHLVAEPHGLTPAAFQILRSGRIR